MKIAIKTAAALSLVAILGGCAGVMAYKEGTRVTVQQQEQFQPGSTTKDEVQAKLGAPQRIESEGSKTHYVYDYTEINHIAPNKNETVRFIFGANGVLASIQQSQGTAKSNNPLLGG